MDMDELNRLNDLIEQSPGDSTPLLSRANFYFNANEYKKALDDYDKVIKLSEECVAAYQGRGNAYFYQDEFDDALINYEKAIELDGKFAPAYIGRGNVFFRKNEHEKALTDYNKAIELDEKNPEAYKMRGDLYFASKNRNNYNLVITDYSKSIELNNKYADAYFERGKAYRYFKEDSNALDDFNEAIKLDKKYTYAYIHRGNLYKYLRNYDAAKKDFDLAAGLNNKCADVFIDRGDLYFSQKEYKLARKDYNKAIKLDEDSAAAYVGLGNVNSDDNADDAAENYKKAIEIDQNNANAHAGLGYVYYRKKHYDCALAHLDTAIDLDKNLALAYDDRGAIYFIKKEYKRALENFREATRLDNKFADAYYQCGIIYFEQGVYEDALDAYEEARKLYSENDASFYVSLLDKKIEEITGIMSSPIPENEKIKQLMDKISESSIKESIKDATASFKEFITEQERKSIGIPELMVLRRWNSYTPIIADKEVSKGGGYFFQTCDCGIVIDPGFNFLDNFISAGYLFQEIDHILITHAHNDHTSDLESILTLLHKYNEAILGDYDTHEEGTIIHDVISDISNHREKVKFEDRDYIEEKAKKIFEDSPKRKRLRIYMSASTFEKYAPMLSLHAKTDYDVVLIKANDIIPILPPNPNQSKCSGDITITAIKAKHDDLFSDRDSLGYIIICKKFVLVYTGDTGYSSEIEEKYREIYAKYSGFDMVLLAHIGGFKEYEKKYAPSKTVVENSKFFYKNHLGRLGLAKLIEILKPKICVISEFGEEFRNRRIELTEIFREVYGDETFFIPADVGLRINTNLEISLIDNYVVEGIKKVDKQTAFYPYSDTEICEIESEAALIYYKEGNVTEGDIREFMVKNPGVRRY